MRELEGKVAVVTGAASGIGRALTERFVAEGMRVVMADVEESRLVAEASALSKQGADVLAVLTDVTNPDDVARLLDGAEPTLLATDPPYDVSLDPTWRDGVRMGPGRPGQAGRRSGIAGPGPGIVTIVFVFVVVMLAR